MNSANLCKPPCCPVVAACPACRSASGLRPSFTPAVVADPAAGASDDWVKGLGGVAKSYTLELHGGGSQGFDIPASRILESASQTFEGIKVFAQHAKKL